MTIDELVARVEKKLPPAPEGQLRELETALGGPLPADYRRFLKATNGGYLGGGLCFTAPPPEGEEEPIEVALHHVGGFRNEGYFSLRGRRATYRERIPESLLWIMDDPYGNAFCLGLRGEHRGRIYFWDHEDEPDPDEWDGEVETAGNLTLLADSFEDFVAGLRPTKEVG